ncbi:prolyl-tRNA synthetase associated domain-containing protein [Magnetospirillum aberrantis]|uniref:Prolyl-tRNA synthetase associated domain-containing protein n=1 Tax=Magnetospirillum aberrantis SpK TaxID=908842 RepID=A0A7C9V067_9PROT|nr:prolyl-tRNA synthetase associated domain-containing protein [Magnetospirillum aberrantis]NFV81255.1 prolyl-tRNA synthetase associated domain-containing protein [Magnetospirillum aberrantis SpK]
MAATPQDLFAHLEHLGIAVTTHHHEAAFTVEQGNAIWNGIPGVHCKNLFLKDAKAKLWLVVAPAERRIDLKGLPARIGSARLSFGSAELLRQVLGVEPGSVTPFALINDAERKVSVVLDAWMMEQDLLNYHPLRNTMTTTIRTADFRSFLASTGHRPELVAL